MFDPYAAAAAWLDPRFRDTLTPDLKEAGRNFVEQVLIFEADATLDSQSSEASLDDTTATAEPIDTPSQEEPSSQPQEEEPGHSTSPS